MDVSWIWRYPEWVILLVPAVAFAVTAWLARPGPED